MTFNNRIDVFGEGVWGLDTKKTVNRFARKHLEAVRNWPVRKKGRVYCGSKEDYIYIYCYGRDFLGYDLCFIMHEGDNGWEHTPNCSGQLQDYTFNEAGGTNGD